jgi:hypothetical protein
MIADKRNADSRIVEKKTFAHWQAKRLTRGRSRRAAAHPANKVKLARPKTPKRNGLLVWFLETRKTPQCQRRNIERWKSRRKTAEMKRAAEFSRERTSPSMVTWR